MIETWFTSDTHFGHKNILEYEKEHRQFETVEEMNEQLISNWNSTVKKNDIIYHLGDFAFGAENISIAGRLNGNKRLVMGNHDSYSFDLYAKHFQKIFGAHIWKKCILTHVPVHTDNLSGRFLLNIHGHLHSKMVMAPEDNDTISLETDEGIFLLRNALMTKYIECKQYFNVSVERHNLTPVHSSIIIKRLKDITDDR